MKLIIDIEDAARYDPCVIIEWPTGVEYEAQTGGGLCNHRTCEGFLLRLESIRLNAIDCENFDDCTLGCGTHCGSKERQKRLADELDIFLNKESVGFVRFNYDKIEDLEEGWWPVTIKGQVGSAIEKHIQEIFNGYIHAGNCD